MLIYYELMCCMGVVGCVLLIVVVVKMWGVDVLKLMICDGKVWNGSDSVSYSEFGVMVVIFDVFDLKMVLFKDFKDFKIIGMDVFGVDNLKIVIGQLFFGIDMQFDGMQYVVFEKCCVFGGKVKSVNFDVVKSLWGVIDVFVIDEEGQFNGVVIFVKIWWVVQNVCCVFEVEWDEGLVVEQSSEGFVVKVEEFLKQVFQQEMMNNGDVVGVFVGVVKIVEVVYFYFFFVYVLFELQNCIVYFQGDKLEFWVLL